MSTQNDDSVFNQFSNRRKVPTLRVADAIEPEQDHDDEQDMLEMEAFHPWIEGEKRPYQAMVSYRSKDQLDAIRFYCEDGQTIYQPVKNFFYEARSTSHKRLSLIYTQHTMTLKGRNLWKLLGNLQQGRVIALIAFHEAYHLELENKSAPFIAEIIEEEQGS